VVADRAANQIRLYRGSASGMFDQPQAPLDTGPSPNGVLLADLDRDGRDDPIVTNAGDGTLTVFLSSDPAPTPTSTPANTPVDTVTPSPSETPSETPTVTPTGSATASATNTAALTPTPSGTVSPTASASPTVTCVGFCVQGEGCANISGNKGGGSGAMPLLVLAAIALLRRLRL